MCTHDQAREALAELGMREGLPGKEVHRRVRRADRVQGVGARVLAYFLLDVAERRLYQDYGLRDVFVYAARFCGMKARRTREILRVARKLRELPLLDEAFCRHEISWTKVLIVLRAAQKHCEEAWVAQARALNCNALRRAVLMRKKDGSPRDPADWKEVMGVRYRESFLVDLETFEKLELASKKLAEETGREVSRADLLDTALRLYLDMERDGKVKGWKHVSSSAYRIVLHAGLPVDRDEMPLFVDTDEGMLPLNGSSDPDVIHRNRCKCAHCDGERVGPNGEPVKDQPTPPPMRRRCLERDGYRCRCCGARGELHVHHIVWRSKGGRTRIYQLITLCVRCHSLVHEGLIRIEGETQKKARFVDREGRPLHGAGETVPPEELLPIEAAARSETPLAGEEVRIANEDENAPLPDPSGAAATAAAATADLPTGPLVTLDAVPEEIDGIWWRQHAHLLRARADASFDFMPGYAKALKEAAGAARREVAIQARRVPPGRGGRETASPPRPGRGEGVGSGARSQTPSADGGGGTAAAEGASRDDGGGGPAAGGEAPGAAAEEAPCRGAEGKGVPAGSCPPDEPPADAGADAGAEAPGDARGDACVGGQGDARRGGPAEGPPDGSARLRADHFRARTEDACEARVRGAEGAFDEAFSEIVGREEVRERLRVEAAGAAALGEPFPHVLFHGPPGTGKTTLALAAAEAAGTSLVRATGTTLQDARALFALLAGLGEGAVLFLDEIHAVPAAVLELLYDAMTERRVTLTLRTGAEARTVRLAVAPFTLLAATTDPDRLPEALRSRFALREHVGWEEEEALARLAALVAQRAGLALDPEAAALLARTARGVPREVRRLAERVVREAAGRGALGIAARDVAATLTRLGYDACGRGPEERAYLAALLSSPHPLSLVRLGRLVGMKVRRILDEIEPFLCQQGWVNVTPRGRVPGPRLVGVGPHALESV